MHLIEKTCWLIRNKCCKPSALWTRVAITFDSLQWRFQFNSLEFWAYGLISYNCINSDFTENRCLKTKGFYFVSPNVYLIALKTLYTTLQNRGSSQFSFSHCCFFSTDLPSEVLINALKLVLLIILSVCKKAHYQSMFQSQLSNMNLMIHSLHLTIIAFITCPSERAPNTLIYSATYGTSSFRASHVF